MKKTILKCPCCDSELKITHHEHYQDLSEHVSNPNGQPSLKAGYQCTNTDCIANLCDVAWIEDGDYFIGKRPENISYRELTHALEFKHGIAFAVNSWNWHYHLGKKAIEKKSFVIDLKWYRFKFEPKEKGWDYPVEVRHKPNFLKWKVEIWKQGSEPGCYTTVIPFWRMAKYSVGEFNREFNLWKENGNKDSLKKCYRNIQGKDFWGYEDTRFYAKVSTWWIKTFYPNKVKDILSAI
jgi:hypothetical protein